MKITKTGTAHGCVVWIIVFGILSTCLLPAAMVIGGFTSVSNLAIQTIGPIICPEEQLQSLIPMRQQPLANLAIPGPALLTKFIV